MKTKLLFALLTLTFMGIFYASTKGTANSGTTTAFKVHFSNNPFAAEEINIDIKEVRVNYIDNPGEWIVLPTQSAIYKLTGNKEPQTTVASGVIQAKTLGEIRLILGTNNSVKIGNEVYPLAIAGELENGLRIKTGKELKKGTDEVTVNLNAALSVHQEVDGSYTIKPVLKL